MDKEELLSAIGVLAFWIGLLLVVVSLFYRSDLVALVLVVLGVVVGLMNIDVDEVVRFLVANVAVIVGSAGLSSVMRDFALPSAAIEALSSFFNSLILFFAPAALAVAIKSLIDLSRD